MQASVEMACEAARPRRLEGGLRAGGSGRAHAGGAHNLHAPAQQSPGHLQAAQTREELGLLRHQGQPEGPPGQPRTPLVNTATHTD